MNLGGGGLHDSIHSITHLSHWYVRNRELQDMCQRDRQI